MKNIAFSQKLTVRNFLVSHDVWVVIPMCFLFREDLNFVKQMLNQISRQTQAGQAVGGAVQQPGESYEAIQFRESLKNDLNKIGDDLGTIIRRQVGKYGKFLHFLC